MLLDQPIVKLPRHAPPEPLNPNTGLSTDGYYVNNGNSFILAILTLGEGWHNNHHYYQASTRQGFFWWEIDITYYLLKAFAAVGLIWDLREPPQHVVEGRLRQTA